MKAQSKTVLITTPYYPPSGGGLERYASQIASLLDKKHHWRIVVVTTGQKHITEHKEVSGNITVYRLGYQFKLSNTPFSFGWIKRIRRIIQQEKPDVINIHMPVPGIGDITALVAPRRIPIVITYHFLSMVKGSFWVDLLIKTYEHIPLQSLFKRARTIISSSDAVLKSMLQDYTNKSVIITPAADEKVFKPNFDTRSKNPTVLFAAVLGQTEQHKGLRTLINAFDIVLKHLPTAQLVVAGDGNMRHEYEAYVRELGLEQHVTFKGKLPGNELAREYQQAHVFALPTKSESFPMVIIEAMSCGLPVLSTPVASIPELVENGKTGFLFSPTDTNTLAHQLYTVLSDLDFATELGRSAYEKVHNKFLWSTRAEAYNEVFSDILSNKETPKKRPTHKKVLMLVSGTVHANFTYRARMLGQQLAKIGHTVSMIAPTSDKYSSFRPETFHEIDGINVIRPFQFSTKRVEINFIPYIISALWTIIHTKADIVYIYKPTPLSAIGLIAKLFGKTTVLLDMDDIGSDVMKIEGHPWHQWKLVEWSERIAARYADRISVASQYLYQEYTEQYPSKPVHYMPNGVDPSWFTSLDTEAQGASDQKMIVFMGSLNRKEILEPLINVLPAIIRKHPNIHVTIIGDGHYLSYLKEKSYSLQVDQHINFTGWLPLEEVRKYLVFGSIGYNYMPNQHTVKAASNMKVPQYMACGVVPVVSNVGDQPRTVDHGKAGYICNADDDRSLLQTLLHALEDPDRTEKAAFAYLFAHQTLSWAKLAGDLDVWLQEKNNTNIIPTAVDTDKTTTAQQKKIYIVETSVPGDVGGAQIRNYQLIKQLQQTGDVDIKLFCLSDVALQEEQEKLRTELGITAHVLRKHPSSLTTTLRALIFEGMQPFMTEYRLSGLGEVFRAACEHSLPDIVHVEQLDAYYCIRPHIAWLQSQGVTVVLDAHNIEAEAFQGAINVFPLPKRLAGKFLLPALKRLETEASANCDVVLTCSQRDADHFKNFNDAVEVIPNGVDCEQFIPYLSKDDQPTLIFIGGVAYPPNADALSYYIRSVHSTVKKAVPNVRLLAIGATSEWLQSSGITDDSIVPLGFVDDIRPYLDVSMIGICPVREGSGTRLKVLTYMAAGLPVVSTTKGSEGIAYTDQEEVYIADDADTFARHTIDLLSNNKARTDAGNKGCALVRRQYDWKSIGTSLVHTYRSLFNKKTSLDQTSTFSNIKEHIRPLLFGLLLVNLVAIFDTQLFYADTVLAALYILIVPGLLTLSFFVRKSMPFVLGIAMSVIASLFILMMTGLIANTLFPQWGISGPLSTTPLLILFNTYTIALIGDTYRRKTVLLLQRPSLDKLNIRLIIVAALLPVLVILGSISLNNGESNTLTMYALGIIAVLAFVSILRSDVKDTTFPIILFFSGLALLLMSSMRGWFITGHDIMLEYRVFQMTQAAHLWDVSAFRDPYNACLSITILPTYLQNLLHISDAYVYKALFQFINALQGVVIYFISRRFTAAPIAFLTGFLYITFPTFMVDMSMLNRQNIAFLFFGAFLLTMFSDRLFDERKKPLLLLVFGVGMIISHYSTSYIAIALFIGAYITNRLLRIFMTLDQPRALAWITGFAKNKQIYHKPILLTFSLVLVLLATAMFWSVVITKTSHNMSNALGQIVISIQDPFSKDETSGPAKYGLIESERVTLDDLFATFKEKSIRNTRTFEPESNFFPEEITSEYPTTLIPEPLMPLTSLGSRIQNIFSVSVSSALNEIKLVYAKVMQLLLLIGLIIVSLGYGLKKVLKIHLPAEYLALSIAGVALMVVQTILPASAIDYGLLRLFQQNLFLLALLISVAFVMIAGVILRKHTAMIAPLYAGVLIFFFLFLSGFIPQLTGGGRATLPLNNSGMYYDMYYTHGQEVKGIEWLTANRDPYLPVQSDLYYNSIKVQTYGDTAPYIGLLPEIIRRDMYVYLGFNNVVNSTVVEYVDAEVIYYTLPIDFLDDTKNLIYNNNGSRIYR
jgi:glycosyltransferase involved in cell wall biosynthesis/uncharacterized membrane protein